MPVASPKTGDLVIIKAEYWADDCGRDREGSPGLVVQVDANNWAHVQWFDPLEGDWTQWHPRARLSVISGT